MLLLVFMYIRIHITFKLILLIHQEFLKINVIKLATYDISD